MNTRALEVRSRDVRLGRRRLGPLRWGGRWYCVTPLSLLRAEQLQGLALKYLNQTAASPEELARVMLAQPAERLRIFAPMFVDGCIDPRHLSRATTGELGFLAQAVIEVNDLPAILFGLARLAVKGKAPGDLAVELGKVFGFWPLRVMQEPAAVCLALGEDLGFLGPLPQNASSKGASTAGQTEN